VADSSTNQGDEHSVFQNESLASFFDQVYAAFECARQTGGGQIDRFYKIGGLSTRLCFAGSALVPKISPAFEHLLIEQEFIPSLTIRLWDSASTDTKIPDINKDFSKHLEHGGLWAGTTERFNFFFEPAIGILSFLDKSRKEAIYWTRDASKLPYYESGAPLRRILHWWMGSQGYQFVHAGAVGTSKGGALLVGKGGSGKSTTALACLNSNLFYAGDDYCMLTTRPAPYVHTLYSSGKLNSEDVGRFPHLMPALSNNDHLDTEKALYFFYKHITHRISKGFPVQAILIPEINDRLETRLTRVSPAASFLALAPSTIFQLRDKKQPIHEHIGEFVRIVPSYKLELGTAINSIPNVIIDLLSDLSSS